MRKLYELITRLEAKIGDGVLDVHVAFDSLVFRFRWMDQLVHKQVSVMMTITELESTEIDFLTKKIYVMYRDQRNKEEKKIPCLFHDRIDCDLCKQMDQRSSFRL